MLTIISYKYIVWNETIYTYLFRMKRWKNIVELLLAFTFFINTNIVHIKWPDHVSDARSKLTIKQDILFHIFLFIYYIECKLSFLCVFYYELNWFRICLSLFTFSQIQLEEKREEENGKKKKNLSIVTFSSTYQNILIVLIKPAKNMVINFLFF